MGRLQIFAFNRLALAFFLSSFSATATVNKEPPSTSLTVAVASNFVPALEQLIQSNKERLTNKIVISSGSSGVLVTQIKRGAKVDVFLSADAEKPKYLADHGLAFEPQTYAIGQIALWQPREDKVNWPTNIFQHKGRVAIAHPQLAPYGFAAKQLLQTLSPEKKWQLVTGQNINQTFQFIDSGNVELGFVALSTLKLAQQKSTDAKYQHYVVLKPLQPILQQASVIKSGNTELAKRFMTWLLSPEVQRQLSYYGYLPIHDVAYSSEVQVNG